MTFAQRRNAYLRNTENVSLRLGPEVLRLARRTAEERQQTLRDFFEAALREHIAAVTEAEERSDLLSAVEEAFLRRLDARLQDVLERVAALSAKEALYQAQTLQLAKRMLFAALRDQSTYKAVVNETYNEAVARISKRGRPVAPEALEHANHRIKELEEALAGARDAADQLRIELARAKTEMYNMEQQAKSQEQELQRLDAVRQQLDFEIRREMWVSDRLEKQGMNPLGRKTAAEWRSQYSHVDPLAGGRK